MAWTDQISGCFGESDGEFAGHFCDIERAQSTLKDAFSEGVTFEEFVKAFNDYMKGEGWDPKHIDEQLEEIKTLENYFQ